MVGFKLFNPSRDRTKHLTIDNLLHAFKALGVTLSLRNAKLLMKRYDNDRDGQLTYKDICDIYKPRDPVLSAELDRRLPYDHKATED